MMDQPKGSLLAALVLSALLIAACGSTVPAAQQEAAEATAGLGGGLSGALPEGTHVNAKGQLVNEQGELIGSAEGFGLGGDSSGGGTAGSVSGGTAGGTGPSGGGGGGSGAVAAANGPGVTANEIKIGVIVVEGQEQTYRALGAAGVTGVNQREAWNALSAEMNKAGGILGHKIVPVYRTEEAASSRSADQQAQEACVDWTQDRPVFATPSYATFGENFIECMERAGAVIAQGTAFTDYDARTFARHPYFVMPIAMDLNTQAKTQIDGLAQQKYFQKGAKVGLLSYDEPNYRYAVEKSLKPALGRHGKRLADEAYVTFPRSFEQNSQTTRDVQNAVLRFKAAGITHVLTFERGGLPTGTFMISADKQQYTPRYGLNSQMAPTIMARTLDPDTARRQMRNARAVGWIPQADVPADERPKPANYKRCLAIMRKHQVQMDSSNAEGQALQICDSAWFLQAALERGGSGNVLNQDIYARGTAALGSRYSPALTFITSVSQTRHDGAGGASHMSFAADCTCFKYTSKPYAVPN
jgi:ABC-type branched-subunit amino acid transport system substrate-binding protein